MEEEEAIFSFSGTISFVVENWERLQKKFKETQSQRICRNTAFPSVLITLIELYVGNYQPVVLVDLLMEGRFQLRRYSGFCYFSMWHSRFPAFTLNKKQNHFHVKNFRLFDIQDIREIGQLGFEATCFMSFNCLFDSDLQVRAQTVCHHEERIFSSEEIDDDRSLLQ